MKKIRQTLLLLLVFILGVVFGTGSSSNTDELEAVASEKTELTEKVASLEKANKELQEKVDEAAPYFALSEQERKNQEAEAKAKAEELKKKEEEKQAKAEAEQKAKEAAEKKKAEEKARKGYETGITYDQLARTPDKYENEKVKFRGKVVQVIEGDGVTQIRLAVNDDYDTILFAEYFSSITETRVLEDDMITVMGMSTGLLTYESTMGGEISIPGIFVEKIEQ